MMQRFDDPDVKPLERPKTRVLGAILAGGRSSRFGSDKALALLDGRRLLDHIVGRLGGQTDALLICGRTVAGMTCVADRPATGLGPLAGLNAALHYALEHGFEDVLCTACDVPLLPPDLGRRLGGSDSGAYVAATPVIGRWPARLAGRLDRHLAMSADRSMRRWADLVGAAAVEMPQIANINTAADLERLATRAR